MIVRPNAPAAWSRRLTTTTTVVVLAAVLASCGSDSSATDESQPAATPAPGATQPASDAHPKACPVDGCQISIASAASSGGEIALEFEANYTPDFERNHIHVFWDSQEPGAISSDFEERGFEEQGKWHPTADYPAYVTQADASVSSEFRGDSTTLCVTAADTDHAVIDPSIFECMDVAEYLN